jgi:HEPN domain-containing protein
VSSPGPEHAEVAALLVRKAAGDLHAASALARDPQQADHVIGFLAQQAVEKAIKAVLAYHREDMPRTHDLAYLATRLPHVVGVPPRDARWLTPWAVAWRYEEQVPRLDRQSAIDTASTVVTWAERVVHSQTS